VCRRLAQQVRKFPDLGLEPLDASGLDPRDAALAHAIYDAVLRRWITLAYILGTRLTRPLREAEPPVQAALLAGAAQVLLLDRVPAHAAINEAVEWTKRASRPGSGLVNAVLRRIAEARQAGERRERWLDRRDEIPLSAGGALGLPGLALPEDPIGRIAVATSHPPDLVRRWASAWSVREATEIALHSLVEAPVILNASHARAPLPDGLGTAHAVPGHVVFGGSHAELVDLLRARSDIWVQDPGSSRSASLAAGADARVIVDACAGQGTKTRQLAAMFPGARIVATDSDRTRLRTLRGVFAGSEQVRVVDPATFVLDWAGKADLVLLDVPCSNTGVLARRVEAKYRCDAAQMERLAGIQRQVIADCIPLLAPKGGILYATCSLEGPENEGQLAWAARWHAYTAEMSGLVRPEGIPGDPPTRYSDGSFAALLRR